MESELTCPLCEDEFSESSQPRLLINCGHTFCETCLTKLVTEKDGAFQLLCPQDGKLVTLQDGKIASFPVNLALMKIIESKRGPRELKDSSLEMSKINKNQQLQEDEETRDLVASIISPNNTTSEQNIKAESKQERAEGRASRQSKSQHEGKQTKETKVEMCLLHNKPLQVVCVIDFKRICASCAIFGEHKGHDFKSIEEIEKERVEYYHAILSIMDKKAVIEDRISSEATCQGIMDILLKKKQTMRKSISEKYTKLISTIEARQKDTMKSLETMISKTEAKLKTLMKIDPVVTSKYDQWEAKSYDQIKILDGEDFESKLQLLFVCDANEVDVLEEGDNIISQMQKQELNLMNEVELALESIGVDFNMEVFNHIENFAEVYDETRRKKSKTRANKAEVTTVQHPSVTPSTARHPGLSATNSTKNVSIPYQPPVQNNTVKLQQTKQPELQKREAEDAHQQHQESLLDIEEEEDMRNTISQPVDMNNILSKSMRCVTEPTESFHLDMWSSQRVKIEEITPIRKEPAQLTERSKLSESSFLKEKVERPNKKKLKSIKIPEKYQKMLESLANDQAEVVDFTNAELGDKAVEQICEFLNDSKAKTVKLIRNKISDDTVHKILPHMKNVVTLNLSQNLLTEKVLDILHEGKQHLRALKSVVLCQNRIAQRKFKAKIDKLKALDINVSV